MLEALEKFDGEIADIFGPYQRDIENWNHNHLRPHLFLNSAVPRIERGSRKGEMVGGFYIRSSPSQVAVGGSKFVKKGGLSAAQPFFSSIHKA
jgi:hypothetical protein